MRQVFIFIGFFICSSVLADHGGQGHSYNGRTFKCGGYEDSKRFATEYGGGAHTYNWALCQLHYGELRDGIATLKEAADDMGDLHAAVVLAKYYISDNYKLSDGKTTGNKANLQEAIDYRKQALRAIRSQKNYPFDDLTGDNAMIERESHIYLNTAGGLTSAYVREFGLRIMDHLNGITKTKDIGKSTIESLQNAKAAADDCLAIPYKRDVWSRSVYNKSMDFCREKKRIAKALLPLEEERIEIASSQCQNIRLSECPAHVVKKDEMLELYLEHVQIARTQLAAL